MTRIRVEQSNSAIDSLPATRRVPGRILRRTATASLLVLVFATAPVAAQTAIGDLYCGTGVETGIDIIFGAIAGLGLPVTMLYLAKGGLDYMRTGANLERRSQARDQLVMAGLGFGVIVLALIAPGIITKVGGLMGFTFSSCVQPF